MRLKPVALLVLLLTLASAPSAPTALTYLPCDTQGRGRFADTCYGVRLLPDGRSMSATCATDGSMSRFRPNNGFNLDRHIGSFDGRLMVVLDCAPDTALPLYDVACDFSRHCSNARLDVLHPSELGSNGTEIRSRATAYLYADCPGPDGRAIANQLDLNPYITNQRGTLKWTCRQ